MSDVHSKTISILLPSTALIPETPTWTSVDRLSAQLETLHESSHTIQVLHGNIMEKASPALARSILIQEVLILLAEAEEQEFVHDHPQSLKQPAAVLSL
jgi:hypothetical protein